MWINLFFIEDSVSHSDDKGEDNSEACKSYSTPNIFYVNANKNDYCLNP